MDFSCNVPQIMQCHILCVIWSVVDVVVGFFRPNLFIWNGRDTNDEWATALRELYTHTHTCEEPKQQQRNASCVCVSWYVYLFFSAYSSWERTAVVHTSGCLLNSSHLRYQSSGPIFTHPIHTTFYPHEPSIILAVYKQSLLQHKNAIEWSFREPGKKN